MEEERIYEEDYDRNGFLEKSKIHRNGTSPRKKKPTKKEFFRT